MKKRLFLRSYRHMIEAESKSSLNSKLHFAGLKEFSRHCAYTVHARLLTIPSHSFSHTFYFYLPVYMKRKIQMESNSIQF